MPLGADALPLEASDLHFRRAGNRNRTRRGRSIVGRFEGPSCNAASDATDLPATNAQDKSGWRICRTFALSCAWAAPWSIFIASFAAVPKRITLDIDDTFDAVHGGQQLRLFNAHYDEYGFQPIVVFDGAGRFVTAVLRPAKRPGGKEIKAFLRRLLRAIRANWPHTEILLRADSHYCGPEVLDWCRGNRLDYILGVAPTSTLRRHIEGLEASTKARFEATPGDGKLRRFKEFYDGAQSWSRVERIIARVEVGAEGPDTRFVVTNLNKSNPRALYEDVYCRRGHAENHIKSWKTHLAADRTSCTKATANQLRLFLHAGAYWLMWGLRVSMPKRSMWRSAQFDTLAAVHLDQVVGPLFHPVVLGSVLPSAEVCEDRALRPIVATGGIHQLTQRCGHAVHLRDALFKIGEMSGGKRLHLSAGSLLVAPERQQRGDFRHGKAELAGASDKSKLMHLVLAVVAIAVLAPRSGRQQADCFVVADHFRAHPGS